MTLLPVQIPPDNENDDGLLSSTEVLTSTGLTYRQLDHWTRLGLLHPAQPSRGPGSVRRWHPDEVTIARTAARIADGLGYAPRRAVHLARRGPRTYTIAEGITVMLHPALWEA